MKIKYIFIFLLAAFTCNAQQSFFRGNNNFISPVASIPVPPTLTTVTIGAQIWTDKNLELTTYRNGDPIIYAANAADWNTATSAGIGAWSYYDWNINNGTIYGKLYNWYAVNDSRGLAPSGYHIPNASEYATLAVNSAISLQANSSEWQGAGYNGTNETGFSGLPGGNNNIFNANHFEDQYTSGWFWTATESSSDLTRATFYLLHQSHVFFGMDFSKTYGMSVRLVKD